MDQFFAFQSQLEQSALYYSTMAMRQMNIGYQGQLPGQGGVMLNQPSSLTRNIAGGGRGDNGHSSGIPGTAFTQGYPFFPPPVINVTMAGHGNEEDDFYTNFEKQRTAKWAKGVRKVNFAYPLSVIKAKSPTPMHSSEEFGSAMLYSSDAIVGGYGWQNQVGGLLFSDDSDVCDDKDTEAEGNEADDNDSAYIHGLEEGVMEEDANLRHRRRKRRKKRKHSGQADFELGHIEPDFADNDPYAMFEVPLNEQNYEFVSELRLCTDEDLTRMDTDTESAESGKGFNSTTSDDEASSKSGVNVDVLKQMEQLYGDIGAQRISQMEEAIEKHYRKEGSGIR